MGWKHSPAFFSAATETVADLANQALLDHSNPAPHPLESHAAALDSSGLTPAATTVPVLPAPLPLAASPPSGLPAPQTHKPSVSVSSLPSPQPPSVPTAVATPTTRDPCLPHSSTPAAYFDVFVDDFIALCQGNLQHQTQVRRILLHAADKVFRPTDHQDKHQRREPVSIKKLRKGDMSWHTAKQILGWLIDTTAMTIQLPPIASNAWPQSYTAFPLPKYACQQKNGIKCLASCGA